MALEREDRDAIVEAIKAGFESGNRNQSDRTRSTPSSSSRMGEAGTVLGLMFDKAGGKVSEFSKAAGGAVTGTKLFGAALGSGIEYIEDTNEMYRALSKVGAGFNGDLGELRRGAALTGMRFEEYGDIVSKNSVALSGFANGVNGGAKQFARLSNMMLTGEVGEQMMNLGFGLKESNEFLAKNMEMTRRSARLQGLTGRAADEAQLAASLEMAESLSVMAKLSGKEIEQMQDDLITREREGAVNARIRLLEKQGITGASAAFKAAQTSLGAAPKVAQDLLDDLVRTGAPMTKATENFAATNAEAYAALVEQANAIKRGDAETAARKGAEATAASARYADSTQGLTLATLAQTSDIAQGQATVLEQTGNVIDAIQENQKRMKDATGTMPTYLESFNDMLARNTAVTRTTSAGAGQGQAMSRTLNEAELALRQSASKVNENLALNMSQNAKVQESLDQLLTAFKGAVGIGEAAAQTAVNMIPGAVPDTRPGANAFKLDPAESEALAIAMDSAPNSTARREALEKLAGIVQNDALTTTLKNPEAFIDYIKLGRRNKDRDATPTPHALGGTVNAGDFIKVGEQGVETMIAGMDGAIIPNMKNAINKLPSQMSALQKDMAMTGVPMTASARSAAAMGGMDTDDLGALVQHAQTTNELLSRLLGVNTTQVRVGEKQLKSVRGTGNLMNGIGRA